MYNIRQIFSLFPLPFDVSHSSILASYVKVRMLPTRIPKENKQELEHVPRSETETAQGKDVQV